MEGADTVKLFGESIAVHASIVELAGISGHADRDMLLGWLEAMPRKPRRVFVNHGDDTVCDSFAKTLEEKQGLTAVAPYSGDGYDLISDTCFQKGIVKLTEKESAGRKRANTLYERLVAAGKRLQRLIDAMKGASNKELSRLTDQINNLCDKFQR